MFNKTIKNITYKDINELLFNTQEREGQKLDYKREFHKDGKEFAKDTTAFANTDGGYIIYGVDEKHKIVVGVAENVGNGKIEDWITNVLNTNIDNSIEYEVNFINIDEENEQLFVIVLYIKESNKKPIYVITDNKSVCYIRKGTSVFSAKPNEIKEMYLKSNAKNEQSQVKVTQKIKGNNNLQVGVNKGTIIKTDKIVKKNQVTPNPDIHISQEQAKNIKETINSIVQINEQADIFKSESNTRKYFSQTWNSFYNRFGITSYLYLPKDKYEEALSWLQKEIAYNHRPKLRQGNNPNGKKTFMEQFMQKRKTN